MGVQKVIIENFKSIKKLDFDCKDINIFIGEPNAGKSNLLEALSVFSDPLTPEPKYVRKNVNEDLFYFNDVTKNIDISADKYNFKASYLGSNSCNFQLKEIHDSTPFRYYKFKLNKKFTPSTKYLASPAGSNLHYILTYFPEIRNKIAKLFAQYNMRMVLKQAENSISFYKDIDENTVFEMPLVLLSDTLLRMIFYFVAILSNKNAVISFEEPETKSFPEYIQILADEISSNENNNQYFIATHNIYFLIKLLENTPLDKVAVNLTYFDKADETTKIKTLSKEEIQEALEMDIDFFLNLHRFLPED